jgi:dihydrofolate reductase
MGAVLADLHRRAARELHQRHAQVRHSTTLEEPLGWNNSTLIKGNVAEEIAALKRQPGKNIGVAGSPTLVENLLQDDLLDELELMVHPVVAGGGKRLFKDGRALKRLRLVGSKTTSTGVSILAYRPAGKSE